MFFQTSAKVPYEQNEYLDSQGKLS